MATALGDNVISQKASTPLQQNIFEELQRIEHQGQILWSSRQLAQALGYASYKSFTHPIRKAKRACQNSGQRVADHFHEIGETTDSKTSKPKHIFTIYLTRYACYLTIQNANPCKEKVALSQSFLASQSNSYELQAQQTELLNAEELSRLLLRNEVIRHNKELSRAANKVGVIEPADYSAFQNHGYMGLYGGLDRRKLHERKGLKSSQKVLDHMGSTELAANLFRVTQTEEKLKRDDIKGKLHAYQTHRHVGEKVRQTIKDLGGTMPEELPIAETSVKVIERKQAKLAGKNIEQK